MASPRDSSLAQQGVEESQDMKNRETNQVEEAEEEFTLDGSVDRKGRPAIKGRTGGWIAGSLILVNQGLATLAFFGVGVNLVLFLTRVLGQNNADAANNVSKWTGTVYLFSLVGAFLSDSYWGRYMTCAVFQLIFVIGLATLSLSTYLPHNGTQTRLFYLSIYLIALGNGGYQPNIATFGSDQFDEEDPKESHSKVSFFSYFYLALNLGSLFSNTFLSYFEDGGLWALSFWASCASAALALALFLCGTPRYRHFRPAGNPLSRICQVVSAASRKWTVEMGMYGEDDLFEVDGKDFLADNNTTRKMLHTTGFKFLDRAALIGPEDFTEQEQTIVRNPWRLCTITQVEEVKCVLRLLPIWLCTIIYSVVFTQMASLFVEQGAAMKTQLGSFRIPAASMSAFDILSVAVFIFLYRRILAPFFARLTTGGPTELQRMGVGLVVAVMAMMSAGTVEHYRLRHVEEEGKPSSLSVLWQVPQYVLIGASEVFMYVGQLEFFNKEAPDGLKSFGSALCMTSISLGNYVSSLIVTAVMAVTGRGGRPGWIPGDLNVGHLDRFYFMLAVLTMSDLVVYVACARWYRSIRFEGKSCRETEFGELKV